MAGYKIRIHDPENADYKEIGPFDIPELLDLAKKGELKSDAFFLNAEGKWVPLKNNPTLYSQLFGGGKPQLFKLQEPPILPNLKETSAKKETPEESFSKAMGESKEEDHAPMPGPAQMSLVRPRSDVDKGEKAPEFKLKTPPPPPPAPMPAVPPRTLEPIQPLTAPEPEPVVVQKKEEPPKIAVKPAVAQAPATPAAPAIALSASDKPGGLKPVIAPSKSVQKKPVGRHVKPKVPFRTPAFVMPLLGFCFLLCIFNLVFPSFEELLSIPELVTNKDYGLLIRYPFLLIVLLDLLIAIMLLSSQAGAFGSASFIIMFNLGYFACVFGAWQDMTRMLIAMVGCIFVYLSAMAASRESRMGPVYAFLSVVGLGMLSFMTAIM